MFSNAQVNGGNFYNVQGDINVQHQHLVMHGAPAPWVLESGGRGEPERHLAIDNRAGDGMAQLEFDASGGGTGRLTGATRNPRHHAAAYRHAPYDTAVRPHHPTDSTYDEAFMQSSSNYSPTGYPSTEPQAHIDSAHNLYAPRLRLQDSTTDATEDQSLGPTSWPASGGGGNCRVPAGLTRNLGRHATSTHASCNASRRPPRATSSANDGVSSESSSASYVPMGHFYTNPRADTAHHNSVPTHNPPYGHPHTNLPPPFLSGAHITAGNVNHYWSGEAGINILHRAAALEALHDSADSFPQPKCHPETRTEMLNNLYNWCTEDDTEHPICWLHGPAGAGKSAIMQTLSRQLQDAGRLGGAFFFKRHHPTRGNAKVLFATLAYQLVENHSPFGPEILQTVGQYPSIVGREMDVQLQKLIIEPCQSLTNSQPAILLLDGLDECQDEHIQQQIFRLIGHAAFQCPTEIRVIVASRPEPHIRDIVKESSFNGLLDSINVEQSFDDVQTYLLDEFGHILREHQQTMKEVQTPWPSPDILRDLVQKSSGYFAYASTVIKFVDDPFSRPSERLEIIHTLKPTQYDTPFEALDQLYHQILSGVRPQSCSSLLDILQCVAYDFSLDAVKIDHILRFQPGDTRLILRGLHSVLKVPPTDEDWRFRPITFHHASFLDFLQTQERSQSFYLGLEARMNVTQAVLMALAVQDGPLPDGCRFPFISRGAAIKCITSVPPSLELVPLIRRIPCFSREDLDHVGPSSLQAVITWLEAIQPPPTDQETQPPPHQDLIQRWNAYHRMALWQNVPATVVELARYTTPGLNQSLLFLSPSMLCSLHVNMSSSLHHSVAEHWALVAQSSTCIRVLQAAWLVNSCTLAFPVPLYPLQCLLKESWDEMLDSISVLPAIVPELEANPHTTAFMISILTLSLGNFPGSAAQVSGDLACGCFRLMSNPSNSWDPWILPSRLSWGKLVRCSPHSNPELLRIIREFIPPWRMTVLHPIHFHDVLQWLKVHPCWDI
ncbi:hypothetical protein C8F04DRAFT_120660 [Mycena alexandri]|uniref:NACHT domain-containing protein n=1 Tax=Mycena alexandri TaxID=1745969 RepID=A0AAD6WYX9_9AGAR|nr:hypothetical protein C8F04DRAFT_120660 [Mycena alexandri]